MSDSDSDSSGLGRIGYTMFSGQQSKSTDSGSVSPGFRTMQGNTRYPSPVEGIGNGSAGVNHSRGEARKSGNEHRGHSPQDEQSQTGLNLSSAQHNIARSPHGSGPSHSPPQSSNGSHHIPISSHHGHMRLPLVPTNSGSGMPLSRPPVGMSGVALLPGPTPRHSIDAILGLREKTANEARAALLQKHNNNLLLDKESIEKPPPQHNQHKPYPGVKETGTKSPGCNGGHFSEREFNREREDERDRDANLLDNSGNVFL